MKHELQRLAAAILLALVPAGLVGAENAWTGAGDSDRWSDPANWQQGVPGKSDLALFTGEAGDNAGRPVIIDRETEVGRIELRLPTKTRRLTLSGSGPLVLRGVERKGIKDKFLTTLVATGILDLSPELHVSICNERFVAGNMDGTIVIRSNRVKAGEKDSQAARYHSDGKNLKLAITDRGCFVLAASHWEPGMSLDMSASHTQGPKVFDFGNLEGTQGVTFVRMKEHDGDPVHIRGFDQDDFLRFQEDPFTSCDSNKLFRIQAVTFVGWSDNGKAKVSHREGYWYLEPAGTKPAGNEQ